MENKKDYSSTIRQAVAVIRKLSLFKTETGAIYATIPREGDLETGAASFKSWLQTHMLDAHDVYVNSYQTNDAISIGTRVSMPTVKVAQRIFGSLAEGIYIDNVGDAGAIVHVSANGWSFVETAPVKFIRPKGQLALPNPDKSGTISSLYELPLNVRPEEAHLVAAWLLGALCPFIPQPLLLLEGAPGSGKSTLARICKALSDPNQAPLRTMPATVRDLCLLPQTQHTIVLDNVTSLTGEMSDTLCSLATGGTCEVIKKYANTETVTLKLQNPVIITGLGNVVRKPDLMQRTIQLSMEQLPTKANEAVLYSTLNAVSGEIFGALLNALSEGLKNWEGAAVASSIRMADFANLAYAAANSLQTNATDLMYQLRQIQESQQQEAAEEALPIEALKKVLQDGIVEWTANELTDALRSEVDITRFGVNRNNIKTKLATASGALLANGIEFTQYARAAGKRSFGLQLVTKPVTIVTKQTKALSLTNSSQGKGFKS